MDLRRLLRQWSSDPVVDLYVPQPPGIFLDYPGTVLAGDALTHLSFGEVIGAYLATAVLVFLLGWTGLIGRIMAVLPPTIVMAMVAGIFLRFGLGLINAAVDDPLISPDDSHLHRS